ncbi:transcription factor bHLH162-like [Glycine soja]|uniref:transcription factor bHLH162 n=1 Tax=Glycine max TaxID=3847 RepID=UPI0003DEA671|nr:transcription factor bHLH162 [Glycine max]XP_028186634.1 transcription factor bHLH162-like [Glycine soja]|eukprot:XP_006595447.1 transcription factor bHLH162 [Glycine max]
MADHQQGDQPSSTKGIERRIVEKNRRNHMKNLCSMLNSLLPNNNNTRGRELSRVDQIDEAINYIKNLETKVKMAQEKKESLILQRKRSRSGGSSSTSEAPKIEIHEEENIVVKSVHSSSFAGNSMLNVVHAEIQQYSFLLETTAMSIEKLRRIVDMHGGNF